MVRLVPLDEAEYDVWVAAAIREYAEEKVRAGNWPAEEALRRAEDEFHQLLPSGRETPNNYLLAIVDPESGEMVGMLWLAILDPQRGRAFIYDFRIDPRRRRRGYGRRALAALDGFARDLGVREIGLHVFGHNLAARSLYEKAGYVVTNVNMSRWLDVSRERDERKQ